MNVKVDGLKPEEVDRFIYLGSIPNDSPCKRHIRSIIEAKKAFIENRIFLTSSIDIENRFFS